MYKQAGNSIVVNVLAEILKCLFFRQYKQNVILNNVIKVLSNVGIKAVETLKNNNKEVLDIIGKSNLFLEEDGTYFAVTIENYDKLKQKITEKCAMQTTSKKIVDNKVYVEGDFKVRDNCIKFIEAINYEFSKTCFATSTVKLSMEYLLKFFDRTGKSDLKTKQLVQYLEILKNNRIGFYYTEKGQTIGKYVNMKLCDVEKTKIIKDNIYFTLSDELYEHLKSSGTYVYMPKEAFNSVKTDLMFKALIEHKINFKGTEDENVISVEKIYDYVGLPKYKKGEKHFGRRIMQPFEEALNDIAYINWKYDKEHITTYKKWINSKIEIEWKTDPFIPNVDEEAYSKLE